MKKILIILFLLWGFTAKASGLVSLEEFSCLKLSPNVQNIILTFDRIENYRFIKLSQDYWYIAIPGKIISIKTKFKPCGFIDKVLVRIIKGETRIFFKMKGNASYRFRIVLSGSGRFLVIRIQSSKTFIQPGLKTKESKLKAAKRRPIIVIDPGHGGKDPGAIGILDKEKNVVLSIGRYVARMLKADGYKVYMTRNKDVYPTLADRVELANKVKADVFVSIHANYSPKKRRDAKGLEVYFLNTTSDKRALSLAARENGMSLSQLGDLNRIILSLIQTKKIQYSKVLASKVYREMLLHGIRIYKGYKGRGVKQAPFYVLVGTRCPSILIETAFINNPTDAVYLHKNSFKKALAMGIALGIEQFLRLNR
ncbi:N-acetylmuramoyl-L-alanine amidase family protein [Hippea maritima]|uniref:N-acetylmuramoyl-L-alanine amidase n=1 Tax=Hippea maritima (strain ATCC 700847 / DSM 10411 / MH2) TaxID=760142 RepID=F2LWN4_HIPMA|nr:N-acetylmuramoyl-L-alanine amidase [Hippea maritima]AEA33012.1 cell wall hydrolase/autolysin [Hippea maritima DSM 10411]